MTKTYPMLSNRATKRLTLTAVIKTWKVMNSTLLVEEVKSTLGLPAMYLVIQSSRDGTKSIVSRHRRMSAAAVFAEKRSRRTPHA